MPQQSNAASGGQNAASGGGVGGGRTVVVTGGAAGIGRGAVERFVAAGDRVVALDRDAAALAALEAELGELVTGRAVDVADRAALAAIATEAGPVDALVCAAGVQRYGTVIDTPGSVYDEVMAINVGGVFFACQAFVPKLPRGGSVVVVAWAPCPFARWRSSCAGDGRRAGSLCSPGGVPGVWAGKSRARAPGRRAGHQARAREREETERTAAPAAATSSSTPAIPTRSPVVMASTPRVLNAALGREVHVGAHADGRSGSTTSAPPLVPADVRLGFHPPAPGHRADGLPGRLRVVSWKRRPDPVKLCGLLSGRADAPVRRGRAHA